MTQFKKFADFSKNENIGQNWQEELLQTMKEEHFFSGDENPLGRILDKVFSTGIEKPTKAEVKQYFLQYLEEAIDMSFGEEWNEDEQESTNEPSLE